MKQKLIPLFFFAVTFAKAQTVTPVVIASDGGFASNSQGSIAWTIGEPVGETYIQTSQITTMGFHQPEIALATLVNKNTTGEPLIFVYPNPVMDQLKIDFSDMAAGDYSLDIVDAIGKIIYKGNTNVSESSHTVTLKTDEIAAGNYFLIVSSESLQKTIKITKVN